jgi:hypothetical protein
LETGIGIITKARVVSRVVEASGSSTSSRLMSSVFEATAIAAAPGSIAM